MANLFDFAPTQSIGQSFINDNPDVAYRQWLNRIPGLGFGQDPRSQFFNQSYGRLNQTFQAQLPENPYGSFTDWLGTNGLPTLNTQWASLAPSQRGENTNQFGSRLRWI